MTKLLKFLIYSNLYVALPVTFLVLETSILLELALNLWLLMGTYGGTLFLYNFHRLRGLNHILKQDVSERHLWARINKNLLIVLAGFGVFLGLVCLIQFFSFELLIFGWPPLVIALGYTIPFFKVNGRWYRLRDIPLLKPFLIAFSVTWITLIVPTLNLEFHAIWYLFLERFFFLLAITIPFDIRDKVFDSHSKLKTFPTFFGVVKAKWISFLFLIVSLGFAYLGLVSLQKPIQFQIAFFIAVLFTLFVIYRSKENSSEFHYSFLVEGTMIFQAIAIWSAELWLLL